MKKVLSFLAGLIGLHFVPENYKAAVTRFGMYHRARGPRFIWIIPFVERVENLVKIGMRFATFPIKQVLSNDGIPLDFELTVVYSFDPDSTSRPIAAQLVRLPDHILEDIVREYADKSLRQAVAQHNTGAICTGGAIAAIEQGVIGGLQARVRHLGLAPMAGGGVMIKEITPHGDFLETVLAAKEHEMILRVLTDYGAADVDQALLAEWVRGFKDAPPTFLSSFAELLQRFSKAERSDEQ
jgi:regulator of protease activity HflC (stomatin/prohibitin superfamily)